MTGAMLVRDAMTRNVVTLLREGNLRGVRENFAQHPLLLGIVTANDVVRTIAEGR
jgi:CBS domain-containing protein